MHILVITDEIFPDAIGGVGKSLYNECVALAARGHHIEVIVRATNPDLPPDQTINGIHIRRFFGPSRQNPLYYFHYPLTIFTQVRWLLSHSPSPADLIYLHNALYYYPLRWARLHNHVPAIGTFYSGATEYVLSNVERGKYGRLAPLARLGGWLMGRVEAYAFNRMTCVMPRSLSVLRDLQRLYPKAPAPTMPELIPLCVDTHFYSPQPVEQTRLRLGLPVNRPILFTARRLEGRMGLTNLIEAMVTLRREHPDVLLLIAGKGFLQPKLEALIEKYGLRDHVRLLGFVSEADLPRYMASANLFVLPTESLEGFGLATIESLASGTPVLGTPVGATPEILSPIHPALVTKSAEAGALAEGLRYWLQRPDELRALRVAARQAAEAHYSTEQVAGQLEDWFEQLRK
ncbi:MAG: glycosyltransferase family 4 protein [Anaerolineae bacterium]|nr:glycosyltransferase family 4 protein [Anaerolineae bacterium]